MSRLAGFRDAGHGEVTPERVPVSTANEKRAPRVLATLR